MCACDFSCANANLTSILTVGGRLPFKTWVDPKRSVVRGMGCVFTTDVLKGLLAFFFLKELIVQIKSQPELH